MDEQTRHMINVADIRRKEGIQMRAALRVIAINALEVQRNLTQASDELHTVIDDGHYAGGIGIYLRAARLEIDNILQHAELGMKA